MSITRESLARAKTKREEELRRFEALETPEMKAVWEEGSIIGRRLMKKHMNNASRLRTITPETANFRMR